MRQITACIAVVLVCLSQIGASTLTGGKLTGTAMKAGAAGFGTSHWPDYEARMDYLVNHDTVHAKSCNETLDYNGSQTSDSFNPPNSTSYQCNGGNFIDTTSAKGSFPSATSLTGNSLPGGVAGHVYALDTNGGTGNTHSGSINFTGKTFCARNYEMLQSGFPTPNNALNHRIKMFRFHSGAGSARNDPGFESSSYFGCDGSNAATCNFYYGFGSDPSSSFGIAPSNPVTSPTLFYLSEIKGEWVRNEICWDHSTSGSGSLKGRARSVRLSDGLTWTVPSRTYPNSGLTAFIELTGGSDADMPNDFGTENWDVANTTRYASSVLLWITSTTDETFWVGPACEIEGGC